MRVAVNGFGRIGRIFLRNILEKTATFLGYQNWGDLLPKTNDGNSSPYEAKILGQYV